MHQEDFAPNYFRSKEAASYCGYSSSQFKRHAAEYRIPRYGPSNNHYRRSDLDRWMESPTCFIEDKFPTEKTWAGSYGSVRDLLAENMVLFSDIKTLIEKEMEALRQKQEELEKKIEEVRKETETVDYVTHRGKMYERV